MADILSPEERSKRMSQIRSRDTSPELALRRALHRDGFRYRVSDKRLPGKPDLVLRKYGVVIFVHGCFWHRHPGCPVANEPKSNAEFWSAKFEKNVQRDALVRDRLTSLGWKTWVVWECELNTKAKVEKTAGRLKQMLQRIINSGDEAPGR